ncbi:MAG TPA: hypothetical protein VNC40_00420 [Gaiellaceae bacterium]|nr:hypothetical protein [Gaiellaceae bacterium]
MRVRLASVAALVAVVSLAGSSATGAAATGAAANAPPPRVTLIGDSVMTGMLWHNDAISVMQAGLSVDWEVAVCRRLTAPSCPFEGQQAPNLLDLVQSLGSKIAPIVVVEMGYNDSEATFAQSIDESIKALLGAGAQQIIWLTLRETRHPYVYMNDMLVSAATRYPQVTLVDWNRYSRSHPEWFQNDGEHLVDAGGVAMATLVHKALERALEPPAAVDSRLPVGHVERHYAAHLAVQGGKAPFRWRLAAGALPSGLRLKADGWIVGVPKRSAHASLKFVTTDAIGRAAARSAILSIVG